MAPSLAVFCLPCPLSVFHTHKAPSLFSFIFRTQRQTWRFKLLAPSSQAQWQRAKFFCLPCPLSAFHTHKAPINSEVHQIFPCLPNLLPKMWWDLFNPLHHGFPSFHDSTLDSEFGLGNLGVGNHPLPLLVPICVFSWVTPAFESFE